MRRLALAAPGVRFSLHVEDRLALQTSGSHDFLSTLAETHGHALSESLVALGPVEVAGATIRGAIAGAEVSRPGRAGVTLLVNGRPVYGRGLQTALETAYRPLLPRGRHPVLLLAIASTVTVLATFAATTLVDEPATAVTLVIIIAVSIAIDLAWKRRRPRDAVLQVTGS